MTSNSHPISHSHPYTILDFDIKETLPQGFASYQEAREFILKTDRPKSEFLIWREPDWVLEELNRQREAGGAA
jgi:hypothetical protein